VPPIQVPPSNTVSDAFFSLLACLRGKVHTWTLSPTVRFRLHVHHLTLSHTVSLSLLYLFKVSSFIHCRGAASAAHPQQPLLPRGSLTAYMRAPPEPQYVYSLTCSALPLLVVRLAHRIRAYDVPTAPPRVCSWLYAHRVESGLAAISSASCSWLERLAARTDVLTILPTVYIHDLLSDDPNLAGVI